MRRSFQQWTTADLLPLFAANGVHASLRHWPDQRQALRNLFDVSRQSDIRDPARLSQVARHR